MDRRLLIALGGNAIKRRTEEETTRAPEDPSIGGPV